MSEKIVLRLADLRSVVAGQIQDSAGVVHDVRSITFEQHQSLIASDPDRDEMTRVQALVEQLVPTLAKAEVAVLSLEGAKAITALATAGIRAVEAAYPNAVGPASATSPA